MAVDFKGHRYNKSLILLCVRWYLRYPMSYRQLEEMMTERGIEVDHSTLARWVLKFTPQLESEFRKKKKPVGNSWRWDEMTLKIKGKFYWLHRAVDSDGDTIDFLLSKKRDLKAALRFLKRAVRQHGVPSRITADKSGANSAGFKELYRQIGGRIKLRQNKYLNNIVEQSHRLIRRMTRPMMGFQNFWSARTTISGIEMVNMIYRDQMKNGGESFAKQFESLAA